VGRLVTLVWVTFVACFVLWVVAAMLVVSRG
jgi:hypothetical protein